MDADRLRRAVALGELLDLAQGYGLSVQVNDRGSVRMADDTMIAASIEEALLMVRSMARPRSADLASETVPLRSAH